MNALVNRLVGLAAAALLSVALPGSAHPLSLSASGFADQPYPGTLNLSVDLRDAARRIFRVRESIPARPGALNLYYPKWIPGEHSPNGTINGVTGLRISAGSKLIDWRRDLDDPFLLHVDVPAGAASVELEFQFLSPNTGGAYGGSVSATPRLLELEWNQVLFYPAGYPVRQIPVSAGVRLPDGWGYGTPLEAMVVAAGENLRFKPVSVEALVDSPLIAGLNYKRFELARVGTRPVVLDVVADRAENLAASDEQIRQQRAIVEQAAALFGEHHFERYHFLLTLSDYTGHFGLEHRQASDNRLGADYFTDKAQYLAGASLMPHEYVHSWNGKFRRPEGLAAPNFNVPVRGDLLWVYEGLTSYLGEVLTARAGLYTPEQYRDAVAWTAALVQRRPGRSWRPLQDTADAAQLLYFAPKSWANWRRGTDLYPEGALLWLEIDTRIRELSANKRSLDDFVRAFHGLDDKRTVVTYGFDDVVAALNKVQPYDWARLLHERLDTADPDAPPAGLALSGWKLGYGDTASDYFKAVEKHRKLVNRMDSIGLTIDLENKGEVVDVLWQGPAFAAGLAPGMKIIAVDGESYSPERLDDAIKAADDERSAIELLVQNVDYYATYRLDYHDGPRFPKLVRAGGPDRLGLIGKARR